MNKQDREFWGNVAAAGVLGSIGWGLWRLISLDPKAFAEGLKRAAEQKQQSPPPVICEKCGDEKRPGVLGPRCFTCFPVPPLNLSKKSLKKKSSARRYVRRARRPPHRRRASAARSNPMQEPPPLTEYPLADLLEAAGERMAADGLIQKEANRLLRPLVKSLARRRRKEKAKPEREPEFTDAEPQEVAEVYAAALEEAKRRPGVTGRGRYRARVPNHFWEGQAKRIRPEGDAKALATPLRLAKTAWEKRELPRTKCQSKI